MSRTAQLLIGAVTDFVLTATATLTGAMVTQGTVAMPTQAVWLMAVLFGLGAAAKQVRGMLMDLKPLVLVLALLGLTGCASTVIKDLAQDPSTICVRGRYTVMAELTVLRSNVSGEARCVVDPEGNMILNHRGGQ